MDQDENRQRSAREKCEEVMFEALAKAGEIVLLNRVHDVRGLPRRSGRTRFNIDVDEVDVLRGMMEYWRREIHLPLRILIIWRTSEDRASARLLERWDLQFLAAEKPLTGGEDEKDLLAHVRMLWKMVVVRLRTLYSEMLLLPATKLARQADHNRYRNEPRIGFAVCTRENDSDAWLLLNGHDSAAYQPNPPLDFLDTADVQKVQLPPASCPFGSFSISAAYEAAPADDLFAGVVAQEVAVKHRASDSARLRRWSPSNSAPPTPPVVEPPKRSGVGGLLSASSSEEDLDEKSPQMPRTPSGISILLAKSNEDDDDDNISLVADDVGDLLEDDDDDEDRTFLNLRPRSVGESERARTAGPGVARRPKAIPKQPSLSRKISRSADDEQPGAKFMAHFAAPFGFHVGTDSPKVEDPGRASPLLFPKREVRRPPSSAVVVAAPKAMTRTREDDYCEKDAPPPFATFHLCGGAGSSPNDMEFSSLLSSSPPFQAASSRADGLNLNIKKKHQDIINEKKDNDVAEEEDLTAGSSSETVVWSSFDDDDVDLPSARGALPLALSSSPFRAKPTDDPFDDAGDDAIFIDDAPLLSQDDPPPFAFDVAIDDDAAVVDAVAEILHVCSEPPPLKFHVAPLTWRRLDNDINHIAKHRDDVRYSSRNHRRGGSSSSRSRLLAQHDASSSSSSPRAAAAAAEKI